MTRGILTALAARRGGNRQTAFAERPASPARGLSKAAPLLLALVLTTPGFAQQADTATPDTPAATTPAATNPGPETPRPAAPPEADPVTTRGPVTNLPLPRFVSMKASEGNVRRGPSLTHRIDWVFKRRDMPLEITAEYGHWRRVRDRDGAGGWVHYSLLSGTRTVLVEVPTLDLHIRPAADTPVEARLEMGVVARLGACEKDWCEVSAGGYSGWAPKTALWGVRPGELRE